MGSGPVQQPYHQHIQSRIQLYLDAKLRSLKDTQLAFLNGRSALFMLQKGTALVLAIIDDISVLFFGWSGGYIMEFHAKLVRLLTQAGLPISVDRSI